MVLDKWISVSPALPRSKHHNGIKRTGESLGEKCLQRTKEENQEDARRAPGGDAALM